jgi:hypothetical protein
MVKKRRLSREEREKEDFEDALYTQGEIPTTKAYMHTLKDVYNKKGLIYAAGYEIKSTLFSLGKRIENLFDSRASPASEITGESWPKGSAAAEEWSSELRRYDRRNEQRVKYILREGKYKDHRGNLVKRSGLETGAAAAAIIGIVGGLLFFSSNLTGNVIGSQDNTNFIGLAFILIGIIGAFFWIKSK